MEITARILSSLSRTEGIPAIDRSIYLATMTERPGSLTQLQRATGIGRMKLRERCNNLVELGWLKLTRAGRLVVPNDILPEAVEETIAASLRQTVEEAPYRGEALAKAMVRWIAAPTVRIRFNARLKQLTSPTTNQPLEYDIYVEEYNWAGEYYGDQHFGPTQLYPDVNQFLKRIQRDREKMKLSEQNSVRLSIITKEDLTAKAIDAMMPPRLPRRAYNPEGPVVKELDQLGQQVASAKNHWDRE